MILRAVLDKIQILFFQAHHQAQCAIVLSFH